MRVVIGTDWLNYAIGKGWVLGDFQYTTYPSSQVVGFSEQGYNKLATNHELVIPHLNPYTLSPITRVGAYGESGYPIYPAYPFTRRTASNYFTSVEFPETIETITRSAFSGAGITTLDFTKAVNLKVIGSDAFRGNAINGTLDLSGMPSLTTIDSYAFAQNLGITALDLSGNTSLKTINQTAFGSINITSIDFTDCISLTTIGSQAFWFNKLVTLDLTPLVSLETIGSEAFYRNLTLTSVDLSGLSNLTTIGRSAFEGPDRAPSVKGKLSGVDFSGLSSLKTIGTSAFYNQVLTELDLSSMVSLETIGSEAFRHNRLTNVNFQGLVNLREISLGADDSGTYDGGAFQNNLISVVDLSNLPALTTTGKHSFANNSIKEVDLSGSTALTTIDVRSFAANQITNLNMDNLPALTTIGEYSFSGNKLTEIQIPDSTALNSIAFFSVSGNPGNPDYNNFVVYWVPDAVAALLPSQNNYLINPVINAGAYTADDFIYRTLADGSAEIIGFSVSGAGKLASGLTDVVFPERDPEGRLISSFGTNAFRNQPITSIDLSQMSALTSIANYSFAGTKLESVTIPSTLQSIGSSAFRDVPLKTIDFSQATALTTIGDYAFSATSSTRGSLTAVDFSALANLTSIGAGAFSYQNLTELNLQANTNLTNISNSAFGNNFLTKAYLPLSVTTLEPNAFSMNKDANNTYVIVSVFLPNHENPKNLKDSVIPYSYDFVGHRINPTELTIRYLDEAGKELLPAYVSYQKSATPLTFNAPIIIGYNPLAAQTVDVNGSQAQQTVEFIYVKADFNPNEAFMTQDNAKLNGVPQTDYLIGTEMVTRAGFRLSGITASIDNPVLYLSFDPRYVQKDSIRIPPDPDQLLKGYTVDYTNGIIKVNLNQFQGGTNLNLGITWKFKEGYTPQNYELTIEGMAVNDAGNVVAIANPVSVRGFYHEPQLFKASPNPFGTAESNGMRLGGASALGEHNDATLEAAHIGNDKEKDVRFYATLSGLNRKLDAYTLTDTLPVYLAINDETGEEELRTAVFESDKNPGWVLSADKTQVSYQRTDINGGSFNLPSLYLSFPDAIFGPNLTNTMEISMVPLDKPDYEPLLLSSDDLVISFYEQKELTPIGYPLIKDIRMTHYVWSTGTAYFNDDADERATEFHWRLSIVLERYFADNTKDANFSRSQIVTPADATADDAAIWDFSFNKLEKYAANGDIYTYQVREEVVDTTGEESLSRYELIREGNNLLNRLVQHDLEFIKRDAVTGEALEGRVFSLVAKDGLTPMVTATSGTDGRVVFTGLYCGVPYILHEVESSVPEAWQASAYDVELFYDPDGVLVYKLIDIEKQTVSDEAALWQFTEENGVRVFVNHEMPVPKKTVNESDFALLNQINEVVNYRIRVPLNSLDNIQSLEVSDQLDAVLAYQEDSATVTIEEDSAAGDLLVNGLFGLSYDAMTRSLLFQTVDGFTAEERTLLTNKTLVFSFQAFITVDLETLKAAYADYTVPNKASLIINNHTDHEVQTNHVEIQPKLGRLILKKLLAVPNAEPIPMTELQSARFALYRILGVSDLVAGRPLDDVDDLLIAPNLLLSGDLSVEVGDLLPGAYRLQELSAPEGYQILDAADSSLYFEIDEVSYETAVELNIVNPYLVTDMTVTKLWTDDGNTSGQRPSEIQLQLLRNGETYGDVITVIADDQGAWKYKWTKLPKFDLSGSAYEYTVRELPVKHYSTTYPETSDASALMVHNTLRKPAITLVKTAVENSYAKVGDVIHYTLTATNTGNVVLVNVAIEDGLEGLTDKVYKVGELVVTNGEAVLKPGESLVMTAAYTVSEADVAADSVPNKATVEAYPEDPENPGEPDPEKPPVTDEDDEEVPKAAIELTKVATENSYAKVGDLIHYTLTATNTGNVTLVQVGIEDGLEGLTDIKYFVGITEVANGEAVLKPGESLVMTAVYTVTEANLAADSVPNKATAEGSPEDPENPSEPDPDKTPVTDEDDEEVPKAAFTLVKTVKQNSYTKVGDTLDYTIVLTNAGNVNLVNVQLTDTKFDMSTVTAVESMTSDGILEIGETWTYTYTYVVTEADINADSVVNVARAETTPEDPENPGEPDPDKPPVTDEDDEEVPKAAIELTKVATEYSYAKVGDLIHYTLTATNTGNVTLVQVSIEDGLEGLTDKAYKVGELVVTNGEAILKPGESLVMTAVYTVSEADVMAGSVYNKATTKAYPEDPEKPGQPEPETPPVTDEDDEEVPGIPEETTTEPTEPTTQPTETTTAITTTTVATKTVVPTTKRIPRTGEAGSWSQTAVALALITLASIGTVAKRRRKRR